MEGVEEGEVSDISNYHQLRAASPKTKAGEQTEKPDVDEEILEPEQKRHEAEKNTPESCSKKSETSLTEIDSKNSLKTPQKEVVKMRKEVKMRSKLATEPGLFTSPEVIKKQNAKTVSSNKTNFNVQSKQEKPSKSVVPEAKVVRDEEAKEVRSEE